ncbi:hypothetical protein CVS40_12023 [Lucilia cuprina]|nr:hypothetical protein CVS40_12023 [Lucilia cuprina]
MNIPPDGIRFEYIQRSKNILFKYTQASEFLEEILCVQHNKKIHSGIKLKQLNVFLDENGIIRACGRSFTFLLVRNYHEKFHNCLHEATICRIKTRFYIPKLRTIYKSVRAKCQRCKNQLVVPQPPLMASLPAARLVSFELGRRREKRWGVLFTCLTVRAIHIEVAYSLDTSSCIMCIQISLVAVALQKKYTPTTEQILNLLNEHDEIKWRLHPPAAQRMGGSWERLVRTFNEESLKSAFCEIEFIINSRPLTFMALDFAENDPLTSNHLLLGSADGYKPLCETNYDMI